VTGDSEGAEAHLDEGEEVFRALEDEDGLGDIAWGRGNNRLSVRRLEEAYPLYIEAAERYRRAGNEFGVGWALFEAGYIKSALGSPDEAWPFLQEALQLFWGHRDISGVLMILFQMAGVALALGDQNRSHRLVGVVDELRRSSGVDIVGAEINAVEGIDLDRLDELTGPAAEAVAEGREMSIEDAVAYGMAGPTDG
jgi:tetratricopeptide (TPR) repeat protein